ncbi:LapA family protein [Saliniramus sp.]|uniref:LapA family protein n=1 Tax=Saliniramus sp. TaxID=2986772 RepID=UPI002C687BB5|nr:LapA family protein [Saliniramus sp.]HMB11140.1 LapA family protein [Saliniramus sp.]
MAGFIKALILIPVGFVIILLAIANRAPITISFDPFSASDPLMAISAPLWLVLFIALTIGVMIGGVAAWLVQGKHRKLERQYKRECDSLRKEVDTARESTRANPGALTAPQGGSAITARS